MIKRSVFKNFLRRRFSNQKGVALIVLLSFVITMTPMTLYMMDDSLKSHQVAINTVNRLKSYYLAKSSLNFSKLILYYSQVVQKKVDQSGASSNQIGGLSEPLYRQFPLDTTLIRSVLSGATTASVPEAGADDTTTDSTEDENTDPELSSADLGDAAMSHFDKETADEFLSFEGDFYSEISEENAKYSINATSGLESGSPSYDLQKKILLQILMGEDMKEYFENQDQDAETLVNAIADYVDANSSINEFDGRERGSEEQMYAGLDYEPKNAKFLSLDELRLVPGMTDALFSALQNRVTVYHTDSTINACLADESLLKSLILLYTETADCGKSLSIRGEEELEEIAATVLSFCPDKNDMANALNVALNLKDAEETGLDFDDPENSDAGGKSAKVSDCNLQFVDFLSEKNGIFTIKAVGEVGEVKTQIDVVLDASAQSQRSWKILNYQVW